MTQYRITFTVKGETTITAENKKQAREQFMQAPLLNILRNIDGFNTEYNVDIEKINIVVDGES